MKKLLYLLFIPLLSLAFACDDSDNPDDKYIDRELIAGSWYYINASDSTVYTFKNGQCNIKLINRYTLYVTDDRDRGEYKLTKDKIIFIDRNTSVAYQLETDYLFIYNVNDYVKYTRVKE